MGGCLPHSARDETKQATAAAFASSSASSPSKALPVPNTALLNAELARRARMFFNLDEFASVAADASKSLKASSASFRTIAAPRPALKSSPLLSTGVTWPFDTFSISTASLPPAPSLADAPIPPPARTHEADSSDKHGRITARLRALLTDAKSRALSCLQTASDHPTAFAALELEGGGAFGTLVRRLISDRTLSRQQIKSALPYLLVRLLHTAAHSSTLNNGDDVAMAPNVIMRRPRDIPAMSGLATDSSTGGSGQAAATTADSIARQASVAEVHTPEEWEAPWLFLLCAAAANHRSDLVLLWVNDWVRQPPSEMRFKLSLPSVQAGQNATAAAVVQAAQGEITSTASASVSSAPNAALVCSSRLPRESRAFWMALRTHANDSAAQRARAADSEALAAEKRAKAADLDARIESRLTQLERADADAAAKHDL
jgi:hypothetical protein